MDASGSCCSSSHKSSGWVARISNGSDDHDAVESVSSMWDGVTSGWKRLERRTGVLDCFGILDSHVTIEPTTAKRDAKTRLTGFVGLSK